MPLGRLLGAARLRKLLGRALKSAARFGYSGTAGEQDEPVYIDSFDDFSGDDSKAAEAQAKFLQAKTFSAYRVGLLHGRMKAAAKREVMERFRAGEIDVLVSTTVIEVGVDVPNATVMIVEDADTIRPFSASSAAWTRRAAVTKPGFDVFRFQPSKAIRRHCERLVGYGENRRWLQARRTMTCHFAAKATS